MGRALSGSFGRAHSVRRSESVVPDRPALLQAERHMHDKIARQAPVGAVAGRLFPGDARTRLPSDDDPGPNMSAVARALGGPQLDLRIHDSNTSSGLARMGTLTSCSAWP